MRKIYLFVFFTVLMFDLKAQYLANDSLSRVVNNKVLSKLADFESCLIFNNNIKRKEFLSFFHNSQVQIVNDIMLDNKLYEKITPLEYVAKLQQYYADTGFHMVSIKPYELSEITVEDEDRKSVV